MTMKIYIVYVIISFPLNFLGQDNIFEILDSLENSKNNSYKNITYKKDLKFKEGEIPKYSNDEYLDRVNKLNDYSPFKFSYNKTVQKYIDRYMKNPKTVSYIINKTQFYFPMFERYLNQFQIPLELKNLAIVESALNPLAKSQCGAAGLWQFMYGTGKAYHLEINSLVDERFDIEKETISACLYLKDLFRIYNDWPLAIAAYNCGPGNVNKAIKKAGGSRNFWEIYDYLPKETQGYVPAFIAVTYVTKYYTMHNINPIINDNFFDESNYILVNEKISIKSLSLKLSIDYSKLKYLNPKYFTEIIPGFNSKIILPTKNILDLKEIPIKSISVKEKNDTKTINEDTASKNKKNIEKAVILRKNKSTIFNTNNDNTSFKNTEDNNYFNKIDKSITVFGEIEKTRIIKNGDLIELSNKYAFYINGQYIVENSKLLTKVTFKKNSIILSIYKIIAFNKIINVELNGEILEKPTEIYTLENSNTIILKS